MNTAINTFKNYASNVETIFIPSKQEGYTRTAVALHELFYNFCIEVIEGTDMQLRVNDIEAKEYNVNIEWETYLEDDNEDVVTEIVLCDYDIAITQTVKGIYINGVNNGGTYCTTNGTMLFRLLGQNVKFEVLA